MLDTFPVPKRILLGALLAGVIGTFLGCSDTIVAPPTDSLQANPSSGPSLQPRIAAASSPAAHTTETMDVGLNGMDGQAVEEEASPVRPVEDLGEDFYEIAAKAAADIAEGSHVATDGRSNLDLTTARLDHPELTSFRRALYVPQLNVAEEYTPLVDGIAEESTDERSTLDVEIEAADIEQMMFSSSSAGQAIVAHRVETSPGQWRTELSRFDLKSQSLVSSAILPDRARLLDVSPNGERALVRLTNGLEPARRPVSTQSRLDIWDLSESEGSHRVGWEPGVRSGEDTAIPLNAAFVDDDLVLSLCADGELTVWDPDQKGALRSIATESTGPLVMTPGRKGVFLFLENTFALLDIEELKTLGQLDTPLKGDLHCLRATISSDGTRLGAILQRPNQDAAVWDLSDGKQTTTLPAPYDTRNLLHFGQQSEYLLVGEILLNLKDDAPVWMYAQNASNRFLGRGLGTDVWAVIQGNANSTQLVSCSIPEKELESHMAPPATSPRPDLGPGDTLAIQLSLNGIPEDLSNLQEDLAQELGRLFADHGLTLEADAEYALEIRGASQKTGESIEFNAEDAEGGTRVPAHEIALTFALTRQSDNETIWNESGRIPPVVLLEEETGQTLEQILVRETWRSAPAAIADLLNRSFPLHVHAVPLTAQLRHGRLWIALNDVVIPESKDSEGEQSQMVAQAPASPPIDYTAINAPAHLPLFTARIGEGAVRDAVATPFGALATTNSDKFMRIWVPNQQRGDLQEFASSRTEDGPTCLGIDDSTGDILFGTESGSVRRFQIDKKRSILERNSLGSSITALAVTSEPNFVVGTEKGQVSTWTSPRGGVEVLIDRNAPVTDIAAVPYTNRVVAAWADGVAMLLEAGTARTVLTFDLKAGAIRDVTVSSNAQQVAFATETGGAIVASLLNGTETGRIGSGEVRAVAFRPRTDELATSTPVDRIVLWDVKSQRPLNCYDAVGGDVQRIVFSSDGQGLAAVVAGRRNLPIWSVSGSTEGEMFEEPALP